MQLANVCREVTRRVPTQDYGQSPPYLERRKKEMAEAQAEYDRYVEESMRQGQMEQVPGQER